MPAKNVGKKFVAKITKKRFLYSHEYGDQKMEGKNARNHFSRKSQIEPAKNVGKKMVAAKLFFFSRIS